MKKLLLLLVSIGLIFGAMPALAGTVDYGDVTLSGGFPTGHFEDVWDLTAGDITISFTYDGNGLVDDFGGGAHAWAELGVRSLECDTFALIADGGETGIKVGDVTVCSDGTSLWVTYVITEPGWVITKTHLAVADLLNGIPQTKKGNPIPGQFDYPMVHDPPVPEYPYPPIDISAMSAPLYIAAHAAVVQIAGDGCETEVFWATNVVGNDQGTLNTGFPVPPGWNRSTPSYALGAPDFPGGSTFYSLGMDMADDGYADAWLTVGFDYPIYNGPGADIVVQEVTNFRDQYPEEIAQVFGVKDGMDYYAGNVSNKDGGTGLGSVDLPEGMTTFDSVKLLDATDPSGWPKPPWTLSDGYDVDAIGACYLFLGHETAWGGDLGFPGKNWATYFTFDKFPSDFNPTWQVEGSGVWLATDYDWTANTFDPDPAGAPTLDLDDKLILQKAGGHGEGDYNLPSTPPNPWANHAVWFDRDGVDQWQALMWGAIDGVTYNTGGTYDVEITLHADDATSGTAYMTINGEPQGFYVPNWHAGAADLMPAGMTFTGDMEQLQVFYGLYGYGATHGVVFEGITVEQTLLP